MACILVHSCDLAFEFVEELTTEVVSTSGSGNLVTTLQSSSLALQRLVTLSRVLRGISMLHCEMKWPRRRRLATEFGRGMEILPVLKYATVMEIASASMPVVVRRELRRKRHNLSVQPYLI